MKRPVQLLADLLKKNELTIAFAESMTCGLVSHTMGTVSNTSDIFMGSIVCYCEEVKVSLLKVKKTLLKSYTAESQEVTDALALNLRRIVKADIHAAVTGLAAPGGSETISKPVGTVFYSFLFKGKLYRMKKKFNGSPLQIKKKGCDQFLKFLVHDLKDKLK